MIPAERQTQDLGLALGLTVVSNGLLFLLVVWGMAVSEGLAGRSSALRDTQSLTGAASSSAVPDTVSLVLSPEPEVKKAESAPEREFINSPDEAPRPTEAPKDARLISDRNMRAASGEEAVPDGIEGLITQRGVDKPFLDLRDSDFREGQPTAGDTPSSVRTPATSDDPPPVPADDSVRRSAPRDSPQSAAATVPQTGPSSAASPASRLASGQSVPESSAALPSSESFPYPRATAPGASAAAPSASTETAAPPAFRDDLSPTLIPQSGQVKSASVPPPAAEDALPVPPPPASGPPPAPGREPLRLTRIPDRVPEATHQSGSKKSSLKGTIRNKGASSLDAVETAEGRFGKSIRTAIEKNWRRRMLSLAGMANPGLVEVEFEVDARGRISNVRLANAGEANPVMQDCALSAVLDAKLPPPPPELLEELSDSLTGGRMRCNFSFLIY